MFAHRAPGGEVRFCPIWPLEEDAGLSWAVQREGATMWLHL